MANYAAINKLLHCFKTYAAWV